MIKSNYAFLISKLKNQFKLENLSNLTCKIYLQARNTVGLLHKVTQPFSRGK